MSQFLETIQIKEGEFQNINFHNIRFWNTREVHFGIKNKSSLEDLVSVPQGYSKGVVKCSLLYDTNICKTVFSLYQIRNIQKLKLIEKEIDYNYKYANRQLFDDTLQANKGFDDIIFMRDGWLTDTSYSNILLRKKDQWFTPRNPLLKGTKRAFLLQNKIIQEEDIHVDRLGDYNGLMLINAMLDFDVHRILDMNAIV